MNVEKRRKNFVEHSPPPPPPDHGATVPSGPGPPHDQGFTITLKHFALDSTPQDE